jgi:uncharacterized membrane protein
MTGRWHATWDRVRTSLWLLPSIMIAAGAGLAAAMLGWMPAAAPRTTEGKPARKAAVALRPAGAGSA